MNTSSLERLLNPQKIAVIGASNSEFKVGGIVFKRLLDSRRRLFPVHPKETAIQGHKVCPDIPSLPTGIDLAVITISAAGAVESVRQCIQRQIPNYIIVAGGFGEMGEKGQQLEEQLIQLAKENPINILGPNSLGVFLPDENIDTIFVEHGDKALTRDGTIACIVQSGSIGVEALGYASNTGYGMRAFVGLGNKCDLDENHFLDYFGQDNKTKCLGFYLENIENGRQFLQAAKAVSKHKPVVVLKAGMTHTAVSAVSSHTGKLAGSDNVISGAFKQFGIQRVYDDEEFCDATKVLSMLEGAPGNRVAVLTAAGGYGVMCTDFIEKKDARIPLAMAKLSQHTKNRIKADTFEFTSCENPVDLTASAGDEMFSKGMDALIDDDGVDIIICIAFFAPPGVSENLIDIIVEKRQHTQKPIIVFTKYGPFTDNRIKNFYHAGVVAFPAIDRAVRAARFLVERTKIKERLTRIEDQVKGSEEKQIRKPECEQKGKSGVFKTGENKITGWFKTLGENKDPDEFDAKHLVSLYDIKVPQAKRLLSNEDFDGSKIDPPYVLKVCSAQILHKTELQGVMLNVDQSCLDESLLQMQSRFENEKILIENQMSFAGPEFIIGIINDPAMGHAVMVGAGGTFTEIYKDTAFRLAPCSISDALDMIDELTLAPVFEDFRGMELDKNKLAVAISQVSKLAHDMGDKLNQLDINPIVYSDGEWVALDVKVVFGHA